MLRPEPMREVTILVPKGDERKAIAQLARVQALHVRDHVKSKVEGVTIDIGTPALEASSLADALLKTRALITAANAAAMDAAARTADSTDLASRGLALSARITRVHALVASATEHESEIAQAHSELTSQRKRADLLARLPAFEGEVRALIGSGAIAGILARAGTPEAAEAIARERALETARAADSDTILLIVRKAERDGVITRLRAAGVSLEDLTPLIGVRGTLEEARHASMREIAATQHVIDAQRRGLADLTRHIPFLRATESELALELLKAQAPLHFGATTRIIVIRGWVPAARADALEAGLAENGVRHVMDISPTQDAPTLLANPRPVRGFESLLSMYSLPRYKEIDPTSVMAITFPVFFGFMLGDIGYGLVLLLLTLLAARARPTLRPFAEIVGVSAASAILFGIAYGEAFGLESVAGFHFPSLLHRAHDPVTLGLLALAFGVLHVNLGLVFGLVTECREHGILHGVLAKGGWFALEAGIVLIAIGASWVMWSLAIVLGLIGLAWSEGIVGIVESITLVTHTLSYLRLAAIGLASVILALVVNTVGGDLVASGGIGIALGLIVILVGHTVNLALGLLEPFLHSLRLHYVEFFMKFYEGGGIPYRPFGRVEATV